MISRPSALTVPYQHVIVVENSLCPSAWMEMSVSSPLQYAAVASSGCRLQESRDSGESGVSE